MLLMMTEFGVLYYCICLAQSLNIWPESLHNDSADALCLFLSQPWLNSGG